MALFKIFKGLSGNLSQVEKHEGYCYFTPDTNKFYIDVNDETRVPLNAEVANKLWVSIIDSSTGEIKEKEATLETVLSTDEDKIPTSKAIMTYLATIETEVNLLADTKMDKENPTGTGSFSLNRAENYEIGDYSFAAGYNTMACGKASHAEGYNTLANEFASHAEGLNTTAAYCQHVQGMYNIYDEQREYAHIVGNGTDVLESNAHTLDWYGNAWYSGDVYVGSTFGTNKDEGSKRLATEDYADLQILKDWVDFDANGAISVISLPFDDAWNYKAQIDFDPITYDTVKNFNLKKKYIDAQLTGDVSYDSTVGKYLLTIEGNPQTESLPLIITYIRTGNSISPPQ